jgi:hypothetical protein
MLISWSSRNEIDYRSKPKLLLRVPPSAITQRVDVMDELLLCEKNTSMVDACGGKAGYSYHA